MSNSVAQPSERTTTMFDPVVTYRGTIYPWHCDHMGHMNVMWYVGKFDEATWHLIASAGLTRKRMREEGFGMAAVEQRIEYKRELLAGDLITIRSWFQEVREKALLFVHEMVNEETREVAARTFLTGVCLDTKTRKARPLPADVRDRIVITSAKGSHDHEQNGHLKQEAQRATAIRRIQKLAAGLSLDGLRVRDLVKEGRRR